MNTGARGMAWFFDEYSKFWGFSPGIVTGKVFSYLTRHRLELHRWPLHCCKSACSATSLQPHSALGCSPGASATLGAHCRHAARHSLCSACPEQNTQTSFSGTWEGDRPAPGCAACAPAWLVRARGGYGARHSLCNARAAQGVPHGRHLRQDVCHPGTRAPPTPRQLGLMRSHAKSAGMTSAPRMKSPHLRAGRLASQARTDAKLWSGLHRLHHRPTPLSHSSCRVTEQEHGNVGASKGGPDRCG